MNPPLPTTREATPKDQHYQELIKINKKAFWILLSIVLGQFVLTRSIVDAGELTADALLECTNSIRSEYHLQPLIPNEQLESAAHEKLKDMEEYGYWAHGNPITGEMPWDFVDRAGYYYRTTGENLALGFTSARAICDAWAASGTHLANIVNESFQEAGFAIDRANLHKNGKGILVVQMFGSRDDFASLDAITPEEQPACPAETACEQASGGKILGASQEELQPSGGGVPENILLFVIISSYLIVRFLLISVNGAKPKHNRETTQ